MGLRQALNGYGVLPSYLSQCPNNGRHLESASFGLLFIEGTLPRKMTVKNVTATFFLLLPPEMPGRINPYDEVPVTKEDCLWLVSMQLEYLVFANTIVVDWAELVTLDLSLYDQPGGKEELAKQLDHAVRHVGKAH